MILLKKERKISRNRSNKSSKAKIPFPKEQQEGTKS
jgi:hypothetical protein